MTRGNLSLAVPLVALLVLVIGVVNEPQNAYAGFEPEDHGQVTEVHCEVFYEWELEFPFDGEREGYGECLYIFEDEHEEEHEVEVFGEFEITGFGEVIPISGTFHIEDYYGNTLWIDEEGTLTLDECETEESEETFIPYCLETTGTVDEGEGIFEDLTGDVEREASGYITHLDFPEEIEGFAYSTIWIFFEEEPQVVEVHCEVEYEFEMFLIFGERHGYGECIYIFSDGSEQEEEVEVGGEFVVGSLVEGFRTIEGTFHIEDDDDNALWLDEEGSVEIDCDIETEEEEEEATPYCLETEVTVEEGEGIFSFLDGSGTRTAEGYFFTEFIFTEGYAISTIWIFFDCEECEPEEEEETKKSGGGCSNCQQPSIGVTEKGKRVVDGGITVNGHTIDADFYHTVYPLIQAKIGTPIDFVFKIWDDRADNIKHVQVQLGKNKVGESFNKVGSVTWDRNVMTKVATVTHDPMFKNVHIDRHLDQDCKVGGTPCTIIHVRLTPTVAIVGDVVFGVNIWDDGRNTVTSFFNDGIQIGTEADVIVIDNSIPIVIKNQLRTDDGLGNVDDRNSEAFQMKHDWHNAQIDKLVDELGY